LKKIDTKKEFFQIENIDEKNSFFVLKKIDTKKEFFQIENIELKKLFSRIKNN
jgi:hypothetical protein